MTYLVYLMAVNWLVFISGNKPGEKKNTDYGLWTPVYEQINVSCSNIKTQDGFKFPLRCSRGQEITVYNKNKTVIATAGLGKKPQHLSEVVSINDTFVKTKECNDIQVNCIIEVHGQSVNETLVNYKTDREKEKITTTDPVFMKKKIVLSGVLVIITFGIISFFCFYISWTRKMKKQQVEATVSWYIGYLCNLCCLRAESSQTREPRPHEGHGDLDTAANVQIEIGLNEIQPASNPCGSCENQDSTLGVAHTHKGHIPAPKEASDCRAMNRNLRDDPGGMIDEDNVGVTIQVSDMTSETEALLKSGTSDLVGLS